MTTFLLASAFLLFTAAACLTWPLWRRPGPGGSPGREVGAIRRQLRQLTELHRGGAFDDAQFAQSRAALERRLVESLTTPDDAGAPGRSALVLPALLATFLAVVAGAGYALIGSPRYLDVGPGAPADPDAAHVQADGGTGAPHELSNTQIETMAQELETRLASHPDDGPGWLMLARSRVALGQHEAAVAAFAKAQRLAPRDADLLADYADALAMTRGRSLEGEPTTLIRRALEIEPRHPKALALAGTAAFDRHDYKEAVRLWETLLEVEPADGAFAAQVRDGIAQARQLAGLPPAASAPAPAPAGAGAGEAAPPGPAAAISGTVTLAPALAGQAQPDDVLFVFARAIEGPRMPVAILRKRVKDLPLQFSLDDSLAMSPESNLSSARRVIVAARISHNGSAMPQAGDLQGASPPVDVGITGLHVEIDQRVGN